MASNRERQREGDRDKKRKRGFAERERETRTFSGGEERFLESKIDYGRAIERVSSHVAHF